MFETLGGGAEPAQARSVATDTDPRHAEPVQLAQAAPAIGSVVELTGGVTLTHVDGSSETAAPGAPVFLDDTVTTASGSSVEIEFIDGTRFSLGQDGQMVLDQLVYDPGGAGNELDLSVVQGAFTFVTGAIAGAPGEGMEVRVPVGTIGIRGTAVGGGPDVTTADPTDYTIVLLPEEGGRVGRIVLTDLFGRSVILDQALEAMDISSLGLAPGEPVQLTREQVIALLGLSIENIEDILNEIENFELEDSPEDDVIPEAGPEQEGQLLDTVPNNGGIRTQFGQTFSLGQLTSLFTLSDQQGLDGLGGPNGGFDPAGGLGNNQGNDDDPPQDNVPTDDGPDETTDLPIDDTPDNPGFITLIGDDGDNLLDASGFGGPTSITGNGGNDTLIGSGFDDILNGGDGDDTLDAGAGNDQVNGGGGNDLIIGGSGQGNDALDGGSGIDTVTYSSATQGITVNLTTGVAFGDPAIGNDTLANIENVIGGKGSDSITGNGAANELIGGEGNDTITGLGGDDTITGGLGFDTAVFTGNFEDYTIEGGEGGFWVTDNREGAENDGTDFVAGDVENLQFADQSVVLAPQAVNDVTVVSESQQSVTNGAAIKTMVEVGAGAALSFQWNFLDSEPASAEATFKDFAVLVIDGQIIKLADVDSSETPIDGVSVQFDEQTGYATFTVELGAAGTHTIGFAVLNEGDTLFDAGLLLDSVSISGGSFNDGFEAGLEAWSSIGNADAIGTLGGIGGIAAPQGEGQALLVSNGANAIAVEQFLGLPPGSLSAAGNQPVAFGNVLDNDDTGGVAIAVADVVYAGDPEDVENVNGTQNGSVVTFAASDGSWTLEFDLSTGDYVFTVLDALQHSGSGSLSFPFTYTLEGLTGATSSADLTIVVSDGVPNAVNDSAEATEAGDAIGGNVLYNDGFSPDGAWVTAIIIGGETYAVPLSEPLETPLGGWLTIDANGEWSYTPPESVDGSDPVVDSFTYTVTDGDGDEDSAVVQITVNQAGGGDNEAPSGLADIDGDANVISVDADNGAEVQITARATDPNAGDSLTYSLTDANGLFEIDSETGIVTLIEGGTLFDFAGSELSITVRATDEGGLFTEEDFTIVVTDSNQPPIAVDDSNPDFVTDNATEFAVHSDVLLANDDDPDGDQLFISGVGNAVGGTVALGIEGLIIFTPEENYSGLASFEYTVSDGEGGTDTAIVHLTVVNPNVPTEGDDVLTGTEGADQINALGGNDQVFGLSGNDHLIGGDGNDFLYGAEGDDILDGGDGDDVLFGNDGNDEIYGGEGNDILLSGQGYDFVDGGDGIDFVNYAGAEDGVEVDLDEGRAWKPNFDEDELQNIENVIGTDHADIITGDENANSLFGLAGNDEIFGGDGDDILDGGDGDDELDGGAGVDTVNFTVTDLDTGNGVIVDLALGTATDSSGGEDALINIENVLGTALSDWIAGDDEDNVLMGNGGADQIFGRGGDDTIVLFADGVDAGGSFDGGEGNDTLRIAAGGIEFSLTGQYLNIENIDIGGFGDNTFILSADDVLGNFSEGLFILGDDSGDTVVFSDAGWTDTGQDIVTGSTSFSIYANGDAEVAVAVENSITVSNAGG